MSSRNVGDWPDIDIKKESKTSRVVTVNLARLFYSYDTVVAFDCPGCGFVVTNEKFSQTTLRHVGGFTYEYGRYGVTRVDADEFAKLWSWYGIPAMAGRPPRKKPKPRAKAPPKPERPQLETGEVAPREIGVVDLDIESIHSVGPRIL